MRVTTYRAAGGQWCLIICWRAMLIRCVIVVRFWAWVRSRVIYSSRGWHQNLKHTSGATIQRKTAHYIFQLETPKRCKSVLNIFCKNTSRCHRLNSWGLNLNNNKLHKTLTCPRVHLHGCSAQLGHCFPHLLGLGFIKDGRRFRVSLGFSFSQRLQK